MDRRVRSSSVSRHYLTDVERSASECRLFAEGRDGVVRKFCVTTSHPEKGQLVFNTTTDSLAPRRLRPRRDFTRAPPRLRRVPQPSLHSELNASLPAAQLLPDMGPFPTLTLPSFFGDAAGPVLPSSSSQQSQQDSAPAAAASDADDIAMSDAEKWAEHNREQRALVRTRAAAFDAWLLEASWVPRKRISKSKRLISRRTWLLEASGVPRRRSLSLASGGEEISFR